MDTNDTLYKSSKMDLTDNNMIMIDRYHYATPLSNRYNSEEMSYNFSEVKKFNLFRWLWCYLAKAQKELGLPITDEMISEMQESIEEIDFDFIEEELKENKNEVLAHLNEFSSRCPKAGPLIHLGATSSFVYDNTDLIVLRDALDILLSKLVNCINKLTDLAERYKDLPTCGYVHFKPAEPVTVGRRFCGWISDLLNDLKSLISLKERLEFKGCKSTTGTSETFLELFNGDKAKVKKLEQLVSELAGFTTCCKIVDQKVNVDCLASLSSLGCSIHKICTDIRLLAGLNQLKESAEDSKTSNHNPYKSEVCCSLARHLFTLNSNALNTYAVQWLERTSDDSMFKRSSLPEAFLTADIILDTLQSLLNDLIICIPFIKKSVEQELPFLRSFTDKLVKSLEKKNINRKESELKLVSLQNQANLKLGTDFNLIDILKTDDFFAPIQSELDELLNPMNYIGCSIEQVNDFINEEVRPIIDRYKFT